MAWQQETGCQTRKKSQIPAEGEKKHAGAFNFLYKEKISYFIQDTFQLGIYLPASTNQVSTVTPHIGGVDTADIWTEVRKTNEWLFLTFLT